MRIFGIVHQLKFFLVSLSVVVFAQASSQEAFAQENAFFENTNLNGSDYRSFDTGDVSHCESTCSQEAACRAWTYVRPGVQVPSGKCWLKRSVPEPTLSRCCISGIKDPNQNVLKVQSGDSRPNTTEDKGPHISVGGIEITISKDVTSTNRPIDPTRSFKESDRKIGFSFYNRRGPWKQVDIEVWADNVDGIKRNSKYWSGWAQIPAGQRNGLILDGPQGGLLPGDYRVVIRAGSTSSTTFAVESRFKKADLLDDALEQKLGPNIALKSLGAKISASSEYDQRWTAERLIDGYHHIIADQENTDCSNCGWSTKDGDRRKSVVIDLPSSQAAKIAAVVLDTRLHVRSGRRLDEVSGWLPKHISISVSTEGQATGFKQVATASLNREFARQVVELPAGTEAKYVRIDFLESFAWPGGTALAEIEIREDAGATPSILNETEIDLAHPGLGGALVTYTGFDSKGPASLLFDGDQFTSWVSSDTYFPQDFTIAFKDDRLADVDRINITLDKGAAANSWPSEIAISVSETSPLDGFIEVSRHQVEKRAGVQEFPVGRKARFLKIRILSNFGANRTTVSEVNVIESKTHSDRSILLSNEDQVAPSSTDQKAPNQIAEVQESEPNDDLQTANALNLDAAIEGKIDPLGELDHFALPDLGTDATALTLQYDGRPNIRHGLDLLDLQGKILQSFDPGDLPSRNARLTFALQGHESFLRLSEPPASVVVIWDTSGSMHRSERDLERAVREYIRLAPKNQAIQLIRFSKDVQLVSNGFVADKSRLLSALSGKFKPDGATKLYDAIALGLSNLEDRDGNRAIVVMTDGENNGPLWHNELWQKIERNRIRLYTIGLGTGLARYSRVYASTGERILGHLSMGTNGERFLATESSALKEFYARIANELASPATYLLRPTVERGMGSIRLLAVGEQVPSAAMPPVHVIFDVSGSMSEPLRDGRSRIRVAKDIMRDLVRSLPEGMPFGLTVYGARVPERPDKRRACADISTVQETSPLQHQPVNDFIGDLTPRGGTTPLWASIEHVMQKMRSEPNSIVVVITDGIEECNTEMIDKLLSLGIEPSKVNARGFDLSGPAASEIDGKIRALGLERSQLNVLGFDLRDKVAKGMMDKIATIGGGKFYDVANGAALGEALKDAISASYKVIDAAGQVVAIGKIDGPPRDVPPGYYTVEIAAATGPKKTLDVRIEKDLMTTLHVNKVGNEMDVAVAAPKAYDPNHECGLSALKRNAGKDRIRRIQKGLNRLGFSAGTLDGIAGTGTKAAIQEFLDKYDLDLSADPSAEVEQNLDCVLLTGSKYAE